MSICVRIRRSRNLRLLGNIAPEHLANDGSARVVWVAEMEPVRKPDGPPLVFHLVQDLPILSRDAERSHSCPSLTFRRMQRRSCPRPCRKRCKPGGRVERGDGWSRRRESLVEPLMTRTLSMGDTSSAENDRTRLQHEYIPVSLGPGFVPSASLQKELCDFLVEGV